MTCGLRVKWAALCTWSSLHAGLAAALDTEFFGLESYGTTFLALFSLKLSNTNTIVHDGR